MFPEDEVGLEVGLKVGLEVGLKVGFEVGLSVLGSSNDTTDSAHDPSFIRTRKVIFLWSLSIAAMSSN